ncbi:uncharacterized protein BX663DRAFT_581275, partial [Cokeromyces recurvatus]|uniref:uncharacterized protein n=1 Tax=Cokeromyces recurvatus TaxID=90255 RepID=UPI00222074A3
KRISQEIKPQSINDAERTLLHSNTLNLQQFEDFSTENESKVFNDLQNHYVETTANHDNTNKLHWKLKLSAYINKQSYEQALIKKNPHQDMLFVKT